MLVSSDLWRDPRVQKEALSASQAGYQVVVLCRALSQPLKVSYRIVPLNIRHRTGSTQLVRIIERLFFIFKLLCKTIGYKPDLIHANDLDMLPAAWLAAKICRAQVVYDAHEFWGTEGRYDVSPLVERVARQVEGFLMRRIAKTVTVSNVIATEMSHRYMVERPALILNAPSYEAHSREHLEQLRLMRRQASRYVVLYLGFYGKFRGIEEAIDSVAYFPEGAILMLRGFGPLEAQVRATIAERKLQDKVILVPPVPPEDVVKAALDADIGLLLVKPDTAPNKLFQYIMAGLPILVSGSLLARELIEAHGIGRFIEVLTPRTLANTVAEMLADQESLQVMSQRSLELARELCWEKQGEKLVQIYDQVINSHNRTP